jgi:hypothetical protein
MMIWVGYGLKETSWKLYEVLEGTVEEELIDYYPIYLKHMKDH